MISERTLIQGFRKEGNPDVVRPGPLMPTGRSIATKFLASCSIVLELAKARISALATVSVATGFILASGEISFAIVVPMAGVFLLASGAAAMNHYLEREQDALMVRTSLRPLPTHRVTPGRVLMGSLASMAGGCAILFGGAGAVAALLGIFAAGWYDGVYTYMKKKTPYAVIPGAIVGPIPPAVGWLAGGGAVSDAGLWAIALFFFLWQVPHFLLVLSIRKDEYDRAGFPTLDKVVPVECLRYINFVWIAATSVVGIMLPLCMPVRSWGTHLILIAAAGWLVWRSVPLMQTSDAEGISRRAFLGINFYAIVVMFILAIDRIVFVSR